MKKMVFLTLLLIIPLIFGCSQTQSTLSTSTTSTTSTTIASERITSFYGVSLGWTKNQVKTVLGTSGTDSGEWYVVGDKAVHFYTNADRVFAVYLSSSDYQLKGIYVGCSSVYVTGLLGAPDNTVNNNPYYSFYYNKYGCKYNFDMNTNKVYSIGIYEGDL